MSDRTLKLLLIERDPIFRTGLRVVLEQFSDLQLVAEVETDAAGLQILALATSNKVDIVIVEPSLDSNGNSSAGLQLCRHLKTQYPKLPILLLTHVQEPIYLTAAQQAGIDGYCPKGTSVPELVAAIRLVAAGQKYWKERRQSRTDVPQLSQTARTQEDSRVRCFPPMSEQPVGQRGGKINEKFNFPAFRRWNSYDLSASLARFRNNLHLSGLQQIDASLAEVTAQLQIPGIPLLEQATLAGQRRELLAARWLVNQLLGTGSRSVGVVFTDQPRTEKIKPNPPSEKQNSPSGAVGANLRVLPLASLSSPVAQPKASSQLSHSTLQSTLFESTVAKLQLSLENLTGLPLEIDIFRAEKKRELLHLILQNFETVLNDLRYSQVQVSQLPQMQSLIVRDLWQATVTDFFGRYSTLQVGERSLEIVNLLLQDSEVVQTAILNNIPLVVELFSYLLFQTPLIIDNVSYRADSPEAMERAEAILDNLLIQVANGVVQPLLNQFADVEVIKQNFYDRRLISTRDIERFRNSLSWKYRWAYYVDEPKVIFESRYELLVFASRGIAKISIYAPRRQELAQLQGVRSAVTLALELRDAIAPRIRAAVAFVGNGIVYVLTQVVGRAIGLIGRGILQGLGGSLPASKLGRRE